MLTTETSFDTDRHHIHLELIIINVFGIGYSVDAILDTGAPNTEFSDQFLSFIGLVDGVDKDIKIQTGLQTQKYNKITLPGI